MPGNQHAFWALIFFRRPTGDHLRPCTTMLLETCFTAVWVAWAGNKDMTRNIHHPTCGVLGIPKTNHMQNHSLITENQQETGAAQTKLILQVAILKMKSLLV